jgi:RNA polymerase sigma-70 factor (sigma-E family)
VLSSWYVDNQASLLRELLAARTPALLRTAFLLTGDTESARDLLQSALERVTPRLPSLRHQQALEAYLRATMATVAANQRRRMWHRERATGLVPDTTAADADAATDTRLVVLAALRRLPADQRVILVLRFYEDQSEAETARVLGLPVGTVKSRTSRALDALRASGLALAEMER